MSLLLKALALKLLAGRTIGGVFSLLLLLLVPLAGVLKFIGLPILLVLGVLGAPLFLLLVSTVLILSAILFTLSVADRQPIALLVFTGVLLAVVLGSAGVYFPRARFLLPGFPLLLPMARGLARARRTVTVWVVLGAATLVSAWSGAYMLLVWQGPP